jgi:hypothetical protein
MKRILSNPTLIATLFLGLSTLAFAPIAGAVVNPGYTPCEITAINAATGLVTARANATGQVFQFSVNDAALLKTLRAGQAIYADFGTQNVSLDGVRPFGRIVQAAIKAPLGPGVAGPPPGAIPTAPVAGPRPGAIPTAPVAGTRPGAIPTAPAAGSRPGTIPTAPAAGSRPGTIPTAPAAGSASGLAAGAAAKVKPFVLPQASFGPPQVISLGKPELRPPGGFKSRQIGNTTLVQLRGIDGIKQATGLPQGAQDFLLLHAMTLSTGKVDDYVVNVQLAEQWFQSHPEPEYVKKAAEKARQPAEKKCKHWYDSVKCSEQAAQNNWDTLVKQWRDEWKQLVGQLPKEWPDCSDPAQWADQELKPQQPAHVKFSTALEFPLSFEKDFKNTDGSASGHVTGSVTFGVPVDVDFTAQVVFAYIPCLPFAARPKSISADGTLGTGATFVAAVNATGKFDKTYTIASGYFPYLVIPINIAGVPVLELDAGLYLRGEVKVDASGSANATVKLKAPYKTAFDFSADGSGPPHVKSHNVPVPDTATESAQVQATIHVIPAVYAALQLDLEYPLLTARVGPKPRLVGEIFGCGNASATQSTTPSSTSQQSYALTADVDWGIVLRAEALVLGDQVGEKEWDFSSQLPNKGHLLFRDLAHSSALMPAVAGTTQPSHGEAYKVKMPACYPYTDEVEYRVQWTGGATATAPTKSGSLGSPQAAPPRCTLQSGQADCWSDPTKDMLFDLTWPNAGTYNLTITPVKDKHERKFDPSTATKLTTTVQ